MFLDNVDDLAAISGSASKSTKALLDLAWALLLLIVVLRLIPGLITRIIAGAIVIAGLRIWNPHIASLGTTALTPQMWV
jgi:ABC-type protease/lipase transport system fused ATPase/permease subunit